MGSSKEREGWDRVRERVTIRRKERDMLEKMLGGGKEEELGLCTSTEKS